MTNYRDTAIELATQAGEVMLTHFKQGISRDWKEDNTPLTIADTNINDLVLQKITKTFPGHSVLGEEGSSTELTEYVWVLDPIDGTIPFSHGMPIFVFSLALTHNGESILGVIYDPILDRMLVAEKGKGTFLNGEPVHVSDKNSVNQTLIEVQSWKGYRHNINSLKDILIQQGAQVTTICTVIYAALLVAIGEYGGVLFSGTKPWDAAAVKIIVEEAGGTVTDLFGQEQRYDQKINGLIVSNGKLHERFLELVSEAL